MKLEPTRMELLAGEEEYRAGREIEENGWVRQTERGKDYVRYTVAGTPPQTVIITPDMRAVCDCPVSQKNGCCRHLVAVWLTAEREKIPDSMLRYSAPERGRELSNLILTAMPTEPNLRMEVTLALPKQVGQPLRIGLRIGNEKQYVVRDIPAMLEAMETGESITYGRGLVFEPTWMRFAPEEETILDWLRKLLYARDTEESGLNARMLRIPELYVPELMSMLKSKTFRVMDSSGKISLCKQIPEARLPLRFDVSLTPRGVHIVSRMPTDFRPLTRDCSWCYLGNRLIQTEEEQRGLTALLWEKQYDGKCIFDYSLPETEQVIGETLPYLKLRGAVEISQDLKKRLVQRDLKASVYLDREDRNVSGTVEFRYGDILLNPFAPVGEKITLDKGEKLLLRDAEAEHVVLDLLANAGFRVRKEGLRLSGNDAVFEFVSSGVRKLQEVCDVFLSREFKRIIPRRASLTGRLRMHGDQLELLLETDGEPTDEALELLEALSKRRRYFRLKSGEYLDLSEYADWQETAANIYEAAVRDGSELNRDYISLRAYRACYLSSMLENSGLQIEQEESVRAMSEMLNGGVNAEQPTLAPGLSLREYQIRGYEWMVALDRMHMGGILADDMGLGKTAQVIALLVSAREAGRTSLVVSPTSLTYNWLSEIHRFAPEMSAAVLSGDGNRRAGLIRHILEHGDVDVMITSYPLIRRDIELMKDYRFRFVILDEAQNIKNAGSVAAGAVKQLQADTRFALTGTPMENGVGELWSIFDFVLPGYLPGYNTFVRRYQDGENAEDLLRRIRPFLTRRLKQEVLEELPDKLETTLTARMTPEQEKLYRAALERLRPRVNQILEEKGLSRKRMEVLSAITELREICCHPSLVMADYRGESGKEEMLLEILPGLISEGRRILLFSQFTRMLKLLRTRLDENGYATLYLDGETPAGERLELTERFNQGEGEIFLISLRAGGSGLNLTGADMVIHYDPWWNPATEDQATDRAHRIGQTKKVQVLRLVTGESIEEQVVELGNRKKALFDRLITPGESVLSALSEQEIRKLFE